MPDQRVAHIATASSNEINDTWWDSSFMERFDQTESAQRGKRCRFNNDRVSHHQRGRHLPGWDSAGEIPWRDQCHRAERLSDRVTHHILALRRHQKTRLPRLFAAKISKDVDGSFYFAYG